MPQEYSVKHDGCYYKCYLKKKRVYCRKEDSRCTPRPSGTTTFNVYMASLSPELQGAFKLINRLVESGQREAKLITTFVNYVKPRSYVYGSPRPIPIGMPHIAQVIPIGMASDEFQWIDLVVTTKKLSPKEMYDFELTPMTPAAEHVFKLSNLVRYKIARQEDLEDYYSAIAEKEISKEAAMKDFQVMAREYFDKRYKTDGRYATTRVVAYDLARQLIESKVFVLQ